MIEHLIRFLNANNTFQFWRILDKEGNELFEYDSDDIDAIKAELSEDFQSLQSGNYTLRGSSTKFQGEKAAKKLPFYIKPEPKQTIQTAPKMSVNTFTAEQVKEMVQEAERRGAEKAKVDILENKLSDFIGRYDREMKALKEAIAKKFDELDGSNDSDFIDKATEAFTKVTPQLPAIANGLKSFKL